MPCWPVCVLASTWVSSCRGLDRWSAASSPFVTCYPRVATIPMRSAGAHSSTRSCTIHALLLSMQLDLLAYEWRSERIAEQVDALDGMGAPGRWLEELYAQLRVAVPSPARSPSAVSAAVPGSLSAGAVPLSIRIRTAGRSVTPAGNSSAPRAQTGAS